MSETNFKKEEILAYGDPHGLSGHCTPDGTPLTNLEYCEKLHRWD